MGKALAFAIALAGVGLMAGSVAVFGVRAPARSDAVEPVWTEVKWPFLLDQWGIGKAFTCQPADCGVKVDVYIRPKIGFCNCKTGVLGFADRDADLFATAAAVLDLVGDR